MCAAGTRGPHTPVRVTCTPRPCGGTPPRVQTFGTFGEGQNPPSPLNPLSALVHAKSVITSTAHFNFGAPRYIFRSNKKGWNDPFFLGRYQSLS
jgi:hypothetical protein